MENLNLLKNWKLHITILIFCMISDKMGFIKIPLSKTIIITLLPLLYSMVFITIIYFIKPIKWVKSEQVPAAQFMMGMAVIILGAKLGVSTAGSFSAIAKAGPALILSNIGDALTALFALPVALFFGMKREAVGLSHANSREANVAVITNIYGGKSPEFQGVIAMYIVGTIFGTITIGTLSSVMTTTGVFHPFSAAIAAGCGSAAMSTAGLGTLLGLYPGLKNEITAYVNVSNLISSAFSVWIAIFMGLPITNFIYKKLEPGMGKKTNALVTVIGKIEESEIVKEEEN